MKRSPLRRSPNKKDRVTPEVREEVLRRDRYRCVGPELAERAGVKFPGPCRTTFGGSMEDPIRGYRVDELQIDHVREDPGGKRRSEPRWLQAGCPRCHLDGFLTRHDVREAARERLAELYGEAAA